MDSKEIKAMLKPLIKQCIKEVLMEEGLGRIISEAKTANIVEQRQPVQQKQAAKKETPQLLENRKKLLDEIGRSGYVNSSFDPFSGTKPLTEAQASGGEKTGPLRDVDPSDPGVDITGLMNGNNKKVWNALLGGKAK